MLTFYHNPLSSYCTRVRFFLEECVMPYEAIVVDLGKGEHLHPSYREQYFALKVPSININGFSLGESNAIMRYLAQKWERYDLYPHQLEQQAKVDQWLDFATQHLCKYIGELSWFRTWAPKFNYVIDPAFDRRSEQFFAHYIMILERHLETEKYLANNTFSIADMSLFPFLEISPSARIDLGRYPATQAYFKTIAARPSWQKTRAQIG